MVNNDDMVCLMVLLGALVERNENLTHKHLTAKIPFCFTLTFKVEARLSCLIEYDFADK